MAETTNRPVKVFRLRGCRVSVFENHATSDGRATTYHKVNLQRTYKDGDEFKTTTSFGRDDLPIVRHLLHEAWTYILETEAKANRPTNED